jgi:hypothetical protein
MSTPVVLLTVCLATVGLLASFRSQSICVPDQFLFPGAVSLIFFWILPLSSPRNKLELLNQCLARTHSSLLPGRFYQPMSSQACRSNTHGISVGVANVKSLTRSRQKDVGFWVAPKVYPAGRNLRITCACSVVQTFLVKQRLSPYHLFHS